MEQMRDMLRSVLGRSLSALPPLDRLAAAWPVAAGHAIAERSSVVALEGATATVQVSDMAWQRQLGSMRGQLMGDLARVSRVPLTDILFVTKTAEPSLRKPQPGNATPAPSRRSPQDRKQR